MTAILFSTGCEVKIPEKQAAQVATPEPAPVVQPPVEAPAPVPVQIVEIPPEPMTKVKLTDDQLLDKVQRQTFRYFWDFGHRVSGMARERDHSGSVKTVIAPLPFAWLIPPDDHPGHGLRGEYFDNPDFKGTPVLTRLNEQVNMNWEEGSPGGAVPIDNFSVRWTGRLILPQGTSLDLAIGSDDGSRLYLNGKLVVDNWGDHGFGIEHKTVKLQADTPYDLRLDFYDRSGSAAVELGRVVPEGEDVSGTNEIDTGGDVCAIGGTGFGIMTIIVAAEHAWITREQAAERVLKIASFLQNADRFHGAFPHWMNGKTGKVIPFTPPDDGGDLVETSYLMEGLLCARQYFNAGTPAEARLRAIITALWEDVDWRWYTQGQSVLYWHWSPDHGWEMNHQIGGWNECLITYVLAASSPKHAIDAKAYHDGWAHDGGIKNGRQFYGFTLPLGSDYGGPLFFAHYTFMGLDPRGLEDRYANYWQQNVSHTMINHAHCVENSAHFKGYGEDCWGLTACDNFRGYGAQSPSDDIGVIAPTAALSSFPYAPEFAMKALRHFYYDLGDKIWGHYGFVDAFSESHDWVASSHLAIDQGPIVVMIENYRSQLMWRLFMSVPEVQQGLSKLGFKIGPHR